MKITAFAAACLVATVLPVQAQQATSVRILDGSTPVSTAHPLPVTVSGGGGGGPATLAAGAVAAGAYVAGALVDGAIATLGLEADAAWASGSGTLISISKAIANSAATVATNTGTTNTDLGAPGATVCATDTGSCSINALLQRIAQRLTTSIAGSVILPSTSAGAYAAKTIGTAESTILAASTATVFLDLVNVSATATVCINFGATATITGTQCAAGEVTLPPLYHRSWEGTYVPTDAIHAIASAASTQFSVGAH